MVTTIILPLFTGLCQMRLLLIETKPVAESGGAAGDVVQGAPGRALQDAAGGATEVAANGDYAEGDYAEGDYAEGDNAEGDFVGSDYSDYHYKSNGGRTCKYKGFLSLDGHRPIMNIFLCICLSLCACNKIVHLSVLQKQFILYL